LDNSSEDIFLSLSFSFLFCNFFSFLFFLLLIDATNTIIGPRKHCCYLRVIRLEGKGTQTELENSVIILSRVIQLNLPLFYGGAM
jgi:hypothetical protein